MIICDIVMCFFFIGVIIMNVKLQDRIVEKLDSEIQTVQDYSLEVLDPDADAVNPDEWMRFFSRFGTVRYITITRSNRKLINLLLQKKSLLYQLQKEIKKQNNNRLPVIKIKSQKLEWNQEMIERHAYYIDELYAKNSSVNIDNLSWMTQAKLYFGCNINNNKQINIEIKLKILERKLQLALLDSYPVNRVYVTFEKEHYQRLALDTLEVPNYLANNDQAYNGKWRNAYRSSNILNLQESEEPDAILWENTEISSNFKLIITTINRLLVVGILAACLVGMIIFKEKFN